MKKNYFFSFAAAALSLSFAACSQDDLTSNADVITPEMETSYAKVRISMGSNFGTRAFDKESFDRGTKQEADVKSLSLMLYDDAGNLVGTGSTNTITTPEDRTEKTGTEYEDKSVSDPYTSTIVKVTLKPGSAKPTKLLAYVNATSSGNYDAALNNITAANAIGNTTEGFVMTNSGYYTDDSQANSWTIATEIKEENLYDTEEEAQASEAKAITIYVERLAAKVSVTDNSSSANTPEDYVIKDPEGNEVTIEFEAKKWAVTALAKEMFTLKQQYEYTLNTWANDAKHSRSYWAKGVNYDTPYADYLTASPLKYLSLSEIVSENGGVGKDFNGNNNVVYVPEHTVGGTTISGTGFNGIMTSTSLIVVGKYTVTGTEDGKYKSRDEDNEDDNHFYLALTGTETGDDGSEKSVYTIYNEVEMIKELIKRSGVKLSSSSDEEEEVEDETLLANFEVYTDNTDSDNKCLRLKYTGSDLYYQSAESTWTALTAETEIFKDASSNAKMYNNGWSYFWGPITHNTEAEGVGYYGVVRNHSYQITINSFSGLGAPMDEFVGGGDPEEDEPDPNYPISPEPDTRDAYINATLNVLSWHNITYGVNF